MKEHVQNHKGEIIEVDVISEEESKSLLEQSLPNVKVTLKEALAKGHIPLEDFDRELRNSIEKANN